MRAIRDVSERAQVSVGTGSHAPNAPHLVSGPTLARVPKAVDELGHGPSRAARSLAAKALAGDAPGEGILVEPELIVRARSTGDLG